MCSSTRRTRLYACAVLLSICALGANAALQSTNDPFRSIVATVPKPPEEPVCCLHPLPPREPEPEDELLLSFEEWKQRAASAAQSTTETPATSRRDVDVLPLPTPAADDAPPADDRPHFTVPLTDRFNFAATDCSARVHATHKSARGAGGVLSAKRDRYMLSPCADRAQHVVVELCDDVRIDTVQLANFEFFSGVFRDIRISVAKTYTVDPAGWTLLGTYRAKNRRGVQSFHPPPAFRDFYRYLRIDILSHYGAEYYCPLSLLRVYGLTHLDEWKWEVWAAESRARIEAAAAAAVVSAVVVVEGVSEEKPMDSKHAKRDETPAEIGAQAITTTPAHSSAEAPPTVAVSSEGRAFDTTTSAPDAMRTTMETITTRVTSIQFSGSTPWSSADASPRPTPTDPVAVDASMPDAVKLTTASAANDTATLTSASKAPTTLSSALVPIVVVSSPSLAAPAPAPAPTGGESIYRVIMNRLSALEANATLYARFVDAHASGTREALRRVAEDVGRLNAAAATLERALDDAARERRRAQRAHAQLAGALAALAQDVRHEKQLGVAQLLLVLAVLVFLGLTRGGAPPPPQQRQARARSIGADLFARLRARSLTGSAAAASLPLRTGGSATPRASAPTTPPAPPVLAPSPFFPGSPPARTPPFLRRQSEDGTGNPRSPLLRPRTPGGLALPRHPITPMSVAPRTHGTPPPPRPARRLARSAHLHELRRRSVTENGVPARSPVKEGRRRAPLAPLRVAARDGDGEAEAWVDTDVDGDWDGEEVGEHAGS